MKLLVILSILIASCCIHIPTKPSITDLTKSIVIVRVDSTLQDPITLVTEKQAWSGTGFAVLSNQNTTYLLTNKHICVSGIDAIYTLTDSNGNKLKATFVKSDPIQDLCLLKTDNNLPVMKLAQYNAKKGSKLIAIGAPLGLFPFTTTGFLSGRIFIDSWCYLTSTPIYPGNSGSPALNNNGEVVGIFFAALVKSNQFSLMISIQDIKQFLDTSQDVFER